MRKIQFFRVIQFFRNIKFFLKIFFSDKSVTAICGHETKLHGYIKPCGKKLNIVQEMDPPLYCLKCLEDTAIKCGDCGSIILSGDRYGLHSKKDGTVLPDYAIIHRTRPLQYVVCKKCNNKARYHGIWSPKKLAESLKNSHHG